MLTDRDICKILNFLGKYGIGDTSDLENRLSAIESIISDENDTSETIDKFNEIVEFLNDIQNTENLKEILNNKADLTDLEELTTLLNGKLSADALYAGAAVQGGAANKAVSIPFGQVDSTSTSTAFTATVDGITELRDGVCVYLRNGVVTSAAFTLNINGLGAKPVYQTMAAAAQVVSSFDINYTMLFIYNSSRVSGGCWDMFYGYNSDTNTIGMDIREGNNGSKRVKTSTQRYQIMMSTFDGMLLPIYSGAYTTNTTKALTTEKFNPLGEVYYYNGTTVYNAGAVITGGPLTSQATNSIVDLRYSFNCDSTLVAGDDVYLVCVPQSDGSAVLHSNPLAFALPTTEDGLLYKRLGKCHDTYRIILEQHKPVYYYKGGGIREWIGNTIPTELTDYSFTKKSVTQNGKTEIKQIGGDTVVWNQMFDVQRVQGTGTDSYLAFPATQFEMFSGHKYYIKLSNWNNLNNVRVRYPYVGSNIVANTIFTATNGGSCGFQWNGKTGLEIDFYASVIDLTLMFGAGNEPSTAEEFEEWLNTHIGDNEYYSYNTGELLSVKAQGIRNGTETHNLDITTLTGKLNGEGSSVTIFPDGLKKAGTIADEIKIEDGVVKAVKRIGSVDMGDLTWSYFTTWGSYPSFKATLNTKVIPSGKTINAISTRYTNMSADYLYQYNTDLSIAQNGDSIRIHDNSYTSSDLISNKAPWLSGVILYYELATPEEYILDNQSYLPLSYTEEKGSETILLPVNGDTPTHIAPRMNVRVSGEDEWIEDKIKNTYSKDEVDNGFAVKEGTEERLVTGISNSLSGVSESGGEPFTFIKSSGSDAMSKMGSVKGNSLVWNQLLKDITSANYQEKTDYTSINDDVITIHGKTSGSGYSYWDSFLLYNHSYTFVVGHKYYIGVTCTDYSITQGAAQYMRVFFGEAANKIVAVVDVTGKGRFANIVTCANDYRLLYYGYANRETASTFAPDDYISIKDFCLIDLTLMFGSGNEPSTVAEFESLFPFPYYEYNAGEIISNKTEKVRLTGFNQWDEKWEEGDINSANGENFTSSTAWRSKNYIPVLPNTPYYSVSKTATGNQGLRARFYDANKNYIGYNPKSGSPVLNSVFTTPDNACYMRISPTVATVPNHDICINISDPSRNGIYMPYQTSDIDLNLNTLTGKLNGEGESVVVFPDGMKSAGSVRDEIVGNKAIKRVGVVDLGTLTWSIASNVFYATALASKVNYKSTKLNTICSKYKSIASITAGSSITQEDKLLTFNRSSGYWINGGLLVNDTSYSDATTFKSAMQGVLLYYELATPEEYILDNPLQETFQSYKEGTLQQIPENRPAPVTAPNVMSVIYSLNADDLVTKQMFEAIPLGDRGLAPIIETTYSELVSLRNRMKLIPGQFYRITDYVTTVNQYTEPNARSAGHPFDIIVFAETNDTLSETAHAIQHDGNTYFDNSNIEAWELRYRLDNVQWSEQNGTYMSCEGYSFTKLGTVDIDGTTYILWKGDNTFYEEWDQYAVTEDEEEGTAVLAYSGEDEPGDEVGSIEAVGTITEEGKGTIIWMKDEFGNECPYDFKNIQFKRWLCTDGRDGREGLDGLYMVANPNSLPQDLTVDDEEDFIWAFTFSSDNSGDEQEDYSLGGHNVHDNVFKPKSDGSLANNVMFGEDNYANSFGVDCYDNSWGNSCQNNSWGNSCCRNSWGNFCYDNSWGNSCSRNSWGNYCWYNSWGNGCSYNSWGNYCQYNSWGNDCYSNSWGNECYSNSWGNSCNNNSWGNNCYSNSWGNSCRNNSWGNCCQYNSWGNECYSNSWGNEVTYTTVFDGVQYTQITTEKVKYAQVLNGVAGTSSSKLTLNFAANTNYTQVACKNSSGQLKIYVPGDLVQ